MRSNALKVIILETGLCPKGILDKVILQQESIKRKTLLGLGAVQTEHSSLLVRVNITICMDMVCWPQLEYCIDKK